MQTLTPVTGSSVSGTTPEANTLDAIKRSLDQYDPDDLLELVDLVHDELAQRGTAHNAQSLLLRLPSELIVEIGKSILDFNSDHLHDKRWFAELLPLMQTCKELQTILHPLRSTRLSCTMYLPSSTLPWELVAIDLDGWHQKGLHEGLVEIFISTGERSSLRRPSTAAAMAGALESAIYGVLHETPCVYIECLRLIEQSDSPGSGTLDHICLSYFVSYKRRAEIIEQRASEHNIATLDRLYTRRTLSYEESAAMWNRAIAKSGL